MKVVAISINTFREALRNKILYSVVFFALLLVSISAFFGTVTIGDRSRVIKDFGLFSLSFFGAIITIIAGVSLLNKELKQKTIYNILSKPVERWQFILGKYLGLTLTVSILVALMGIGLVCFLGVLEGRVDWLMFQGIVLILLEVVVIAAISMFFSSLVVTTTLSGLFTLGAYIAGRSMSSVRYYMLHSEEPNEALLTLVHLLDKVLPDLSLFNMNDLIVYGSPVSGGSFLHAVIYCGAYSLVALVLAVLIFERREFT